METVCVIQDVRRIQSALPFKVSFWEICFTYLRLLVFKLITVFYVFWAVPLQIHSTLREQPKLCLLSSIFCSFVGIKCKRQFCYFSVISSLFLCSLKSGNSRFFLVMKSHQKTNIQSLCAFRLSYPVSDTQPWALLFLLEMCIF